tara:strand:- start:437 stop:1129 length:693 start_codon:yes stop_codon:yes gene_type:complete
MSRILSFGDSWCYGFELDKPETQCYTHLLSEKINSEYINYGLNGNSFSKITNEILTEEIDKSDFILVCIPPDIRFIGESPDGKFISLFNTDNKNTDKFIQKQFDYYNEVLVKHKNWHPYFQLLNLFCIQEYLTKIGVSFLFFTNYGSIDYSFKFNGKIDKSNFLIDTSLTTFLGGKDSGIIPSSLNVDALEQSCFEGKYFEGNESHPNVKGHEKISNLIYNSSKFQQWLK